MEKNEIISILNDWNFWKEELDTGFPRQDYLQRLKDLAKTGQIVVVTGPRRAGKSYLMRQAAKDLFGQGIRREDILMINFEDPRWPKIDSALLQKIFETYLEFLRPAIKPILFLDEIQEVKEWEKWVLSIQERDKARLFLSGSNAKLLSRELGTLLTGRHVKLTVLPLSFEEYLFFNGIILKDSLDIVQKRIAIQSHLRSYLKEGAFPLVTLAEEKKPILFNYFEDIVTKDLVRRFKIRKTEQLKSLAKFYLNHPASQITFNSIEKFLKITADTIEKFSGYFEEVYLFFFVKRYTRKPKEEEKSPRKLYPVDSGLANAVGTSPTPNWGRLAETVVFLELTRRRLQNPDQEIFYWKDPQHREVDFCIREERNITQLIQVCWNLNHPKTKERELKSLLKALNELNLKKGLIITEEEEKTENIGDKEVQYEPLWKWLLDLFVE